MKKNDILQLFQFLTVFATLFYMTKYNVDIENDTLLFGKY